MKPWLLAGWRLIRVPLIPVALYLALHPALTVLSERHGFGSPDGLGFAYLTVTVVLVALRMVVLVIVPAVLVYRVVVCAVRSIADRVSARSG
ncbi:MULTISPECIES: hypothetical protein [unclassified Nocardia]|uniref:hypothetical protein n=1 Tax=unclassified Nocardia TaxID=2637762 RepID=UPI001CE3C131|nr:MULTISPECIES: hypothetical protein [unclassified Nocardia]